VRSLRSEPLSHIPERARTAASETRRFEPLEFAQPGGCETRTDGTEIPPDQWDTALW
jgi:hypothetical protein